MKRNLFYLALIILTAISSFKIAGLEFILLVIILISLIFLVIVGLISIYRKTGKNFLRVPRIIIGICFIGAMVAFFRPYEDAIINSGTNSEKLQYAYNTDQNDRKQLKSYIPFLSDLDNRDDKRLNQAKRVAEQAEKLKSMDKFYAAFIFHHSDNSNDYETASKLAADAAKNLQFKDNYQVQWLEKAAYDRWMLSIGKPEKYNTQNKFSIEIDQ